MTSPADAMVPWFIMTKPASQQTMDTAAAHASSRPGAVGMQLRGLPGVPPVRLPIPPPPGLTSEFEAADTSKVAVKSHDRCGSDVSTADDSEGEATPPTSPPVPESEPNWACDLEEATPVQRLPPGQPAPHIGLHMPPPPGLTFEAETANDSGRAAKSRNKCGFGVRTADDSEAAAAPRMPQAPMLEFEPRSWAHSLEGAIRQLLPPAPPALQGSEPRRKFEVLPAPAALSAPQRPQKPPVPQAVQPRPAAPGPQQPQAFPVAPERAVPRAAGAQPGEHLGRMEMPPPTAPAQAEMTPVPPPPPPATTSIGSIGHSFGICKPCDFTYKTGSCRQGTACNFCHLCGPEVRKLFKKERRALVKHQKAASALGLKADALTLFGLKAVAS